MNLSRIYYVVVAVALAFGTQSANGSARIEVPIDVHNLHVYVKVTLGNSKPLWFLVDSGAATPVNLIDKSAADRVGLEGEGHTKAGAIGGSVGITFSQAVVLRAGAAEIPAARLGIIPLSDSKQQEGHSVDGILAFPFFSAFNPEIDYPARRMYLSGSPGIPHVGNAVPLQIVNKNCRIDAEIVLAPRHAPLSVKLIIDTGFDGALVLNSPFVQRHGLLRIAKDSVAGASLGGSTAGKLLRITSLSIGKQTEESVEARLSSDTEGAFSTSDVDGYVGGAVLQHYSVLFDYSHGRLVMVRKPGR